MHMQLPYFDDLSFSAWEARATELGFGSGQLRNVFRKIHLRTGDDWDTLGIPSRQLVKLRAQFRLAPLPGIVRRTESTDGTVKFLLGMGDGSAVEAVHIPDENRGTVCISSQVGCAIGCDFCFTAKMGLTRNLEPHEIVGQWKRVRAELPERAFTNIVFMGMGEPLHNTDNVISAISVLTHDYALGIPARRITVSTSGLLPGIQKLFDQTTVRLALSVNGSSPEGRQKVMPIEKAYGIEDILAFLRSRKIGNHHEPMFEYVLLGGVNDSDEDAAKLIELLNGVPGRVNLIAFNPHPGSAYGRPAEERVYRFHALLRKTGRPVFIRQSRGQDALAACGQLHHADSKTRSRFDRLVASNA